MITFLNDKVDKQLRGSFFDCIDNVVRFVGYLCSPILVPLLEQVQVYKYNYDRKIYWFHV